MYLALHKVLNNKNIFPISAFSSKNTVGPDHVYAIPKRQVLKDSDMKQWENSEAYHVSRHHIHLYVFQKILAYFSCPDNKKYS